MSEIYEYQDDTIPQHVAHFYRQQARDRAEAVLSRADTLRPSLDDDEMRQIEPLQNFVTHNFL